MGSFAMPAKGANVIPNGHFRKDWKRFVRTWHNQPARHERRRNARLAKAAKLAPRPAAGPLRPVVHCQTIRYNSKLRAGKGFSHDELKAVDHRRRNKSAESIQVNAQRLKSYKSKMILFPRKLTKPKKGDATAEEMKMATQSKRADVLTIRQPARVQKARKITDAEKKFSSFSMLRKVRADK